MSKTPTNTCNAYKSLPNIFFSSKSTQIKHLYKSKSLPSCFKFHHRQYYSNRKCSITKLINKTKINPTIGELLGDDDLFHYHYHHRYSPSRYKRKRYYDNHRKYHHKRNRYQSQNIQSTSEINQIYIYPTTYNYTQVPSYCYYCYSNMPSYCPYLTLNCYENSRT